VCIQIVLRKDTAWLEQTACGEIRFPTPPFSGDAWTSQGEESERFLSERYCILPLEPNHNHSFPRGRRFPRVFHFGRNRPNGAGRKSIYSGSADMKPIILPEYWFDYRCTWELISSS